ncbi:IS982 family transposase [Porphyromonas gingivalis]|nr:IS982 family transposase [Porphyromonas gingivalis]
MTILILFHLSRYRDLKAFYLQYITHSCRSEFPHLVSYNRFVELQSRVGFKLIAFLNMCCLGQCTGISFIDSTPLKACHIKRAHGHRTMRGWAQKGKSTMGWFYGFKLHIVINDRGEIINYQITPGNCDDREPLKDGTFTKNLFGKLIADRGYISQNLFDRLFVDDIHMITKRQFDLSEHTIKITSSCKSYSFVILRLHNDREEGAASKSLGFRCR